MDGFNATVLAYGQTGSGKTFSMGTEFLDNTKDKENQGIVPRCMLELFQVLQDKAENEDGYSYEVLVSFLELHNEDLIDLLNPPAIQKRRSHNGQVPQHAEVSIREDIAGNIYWTGVKEEKCYSPEELLGLLEKGSSCRTTASTEMNSVSSRSHAMFTVTLKQQFLEQTDQDDSKKIPKCLTSKFHFVDLAGSERLKRTNAEGDRAKEGIAINAGLLALGNVISALGDDTRRAVHVPYRDSKLTRLLQDSLGGNSQTLMLACVSPSDSNFGETLNTLRYANRARNIKNKVTVNQDFTGSSVEVNQLRALVARLRMEITALRSKEVGLPLDDTTTDDETQVLRKEISTLRERLQHTTNDMIQATTERNTLLMERDTTIDDAMETTVTDNNQQLVIATHPVIANYLKIIHDLNNDLTETKDRLQVLENAQHPPVLYDQPSATPSDDLRQRRRRPGQISYSKRRFVKAGKTSTNSSTTTNSTTIKISRQQRQRMGIIKPSGHLRKHRSTATLTMLPSVERNNNHYRYASDNSVNYYRNSTLMDDEDEGYVNDTEDENMRIEFKESIAKARAEIKKGMEFLELITPNDDKNMDLGESKSEVLTKTQPLKREPSDEGTFSASPSPTPSTDNLYRELPQWLADIDPSYSSNTNSPSTNHSSTNKGSADSCVDLDNQQQDPKLLRMLQQIQSDIKVNEELVCQLEKSESEYILMRRKFDDKINHLHEQLAGLQQDREEALQQTKGLSKIPTNSGGLSLDASQHQQQTSRDKQQLSEIRQAYETKMKHLLNEIQELKRKYSQTTNAMNVTRNQNESLLKSLKVNVETLKLEKKQMMKRMKHDGDRVREQITQQDRRLQQLQRQHTEASVARRRLERERDIQKQTLRKRTEEMVINSGQLKQLVFIMKKAVREGGMLDERLLGKVSHIIGGNFAVLGRASHGFPLRGGGHSRSSPKSNSNHGQQRSNKSTVPLYIRASRKRTLLEKAMCQYVQGKQTLVELEQLLDRRERLSDEKQELMDKRRHVYHMEIQRTNTTGSPMDTASIEFMDEQIELLAAEISFLSCRLGDLQKKVMSISSNQQRTKKHVTFADDIVTDPPPSDEWADMDAFEDQYSLPANATPEISYKVASKVLKSLKADEWKQIAESLLDSTLKLQIAQNNKQITLQYLERALMETRYSLIVMRRAAVASTVENERRIRRLENSINGNNGHEVLDLESVAAMDRKMEEYISSGNTIFDKIYEEGLRGIATNATWPSMEDSNNINDGSTSPGLVSSEDSCSTDALSTPSSLNQVFLLSSARQDAATPDYAPSDNENSSAEKLEYGNRPNAPTILPLVEDEDFVSLEDNQLDFPSPPLRIETTSLPPNTMESTQQDSNDISALSLDLHTPIELPQTSPDHIKQPNNNLRKPPPTALRLEQHTDVHLTRQHPTSSTPLPKKTMDLITPPTTPNRPRSSSLLLRQQKQPIVVPSPSSPLLTKQSQRHSLPVSLSTHNMPSSCALGGNNVFNRLASTSTRASRAKVHRLSC
ncbi:hypothetical protein BC941DRAFT_434987 [Chlamydoabsidia padenii]|nr:hypothetical protein BC941DRAFT_434987 [Chlamydoabsidia padenii]